MYALSINICWIDAKLDARFRISKVRNTENLKLIRKRLSDSPVSGENEIYIDGKLYDVAITERSKDSVYYYVLEDNEEEDALDQAFLSVRSETSLFNGQGLQLSRHKVVIKGLDLLYNFKWIEYKLYNRSPALYLDDQDKECVFRNDEILTPPPQTAQQFRNVA